MAVIINDLSDPLPTIKLLGSFYWRLFNAPEQLTELYRVTGLADQQLAIDMTELQLISSRQRIPKYHFQYTIPISITRTKFAQARYAVIRYGVPTNGQIAVYGTQPITGEVYRYGVPVFSDRLSWGLGYNAMRIDMIADKPVDADAYLMDGFDYTLVDNRIIFMENPFESGVFPLNKITTPDGKEDVEITLWLRGVIIDRSDMGKTYGEPVSLYGQTSDGYRNLINSYWDALTNCPSTTNINRFIGAVTDTPVAVDWETAEDDGVCDTYKWLATDRNVYRASLNTSWTVTQGSKLTPGQFLTDGVIPLLSDSDTPKGLFDVRIPKRYLARELANDVIFPNRYVNLKYDAPDLVTFDFDASPEDIAMFWERYYINASRRNIDGSVIIKDSAVHGKINPAEFMLRTGLKYNYSIYKLNPAGYGKNKLSQGLLSFLRNAMLPGHTILFYQ